MIIQQSDKHREPTVQRWEKKHQEDISNAGKMTLLCLHQTNFNTLETSTMTCDNVLQITWSLTLLCIVLDIFHRVNGRSLEVTGLYSLCHAPVQMVVVMQVQLYANGDKMHKNKEEEEESRRHKLVVIQYQQQQALKQEHQKKIT